jgi:hypothetical protein
VSWHLFDALCAFRLVDLSQRDESARLALLCSSYAFQLESEGEWLWALYVLMTLPGDHSVLRIAAVRQVLMRHAARFDTYDVTSDADSIRTVRATLMELGIPSSWLHEAVAYRRAMLGDRIGQFESLCAASQFQSANDLLLGAILPPLVLQHRQQLLMAGGTSLAVRHDGSGAERFTSMKTLEKMLTTLDANRTQIVQWEFHGQVWLTFVKTTMEIRMALNSVEVTVRRREREQK